MESKEATRRAIVERLLRMSAKDRDMESRVLCKELGHVLGAVPRGIAGYMPLSDEPDIRPLLTKLQEAGWRIALPRMEKHTFSMRTAADLGALIPGPIGPLEPPPSAPVAEAQSIDVVIVPGRAFTKDGKRIGRGNGGYDHWIHAQRAEHPATTFIGVGFECQIVPDLPMEPHDERVDMIVTSRGPLAIA